jgi:hypothetical protein
MPTVTLIFRRAETANENGSVPGTLTVGDKDYPTIEAGGVTSVRKGSYTLKMDIKNTHRRIQCLRFTDPGMRTLLIHDVWRDDPQYVQGCIAPGLRSDARGIHDSAKAMAEIIAALGGFQQDQPVPITIENNAPGVQGGKDEWLKFRVAHHKW